MCCRVLDSGASGENQVAVGCEHNNELLGSTEGG
jgi:hypothetical protein